MESHFKRILFIVAVGLICFTPVQRLSSQDQKKQNDHMEIEVKDVFVKTGYRDVVSYSDHFIVVGSKGRIDHLNYSGAITHTINVCQYALNCVISENQEVLAVGDKGTILLSSDGRTFISVKSGTTKDIHSVTNFDGMLIASADDGLLLVSKNGTLWSKLQLEVKGNIVSVTSNLSLCYGVSDRGEIISSYDGINWKILDFNKEYSGYYKPCIFNKALMSNNRIVLAGRHVDGTPVVLFSTMGNVWTERTLVYDDEQGVPTLLSTVPNDIAYDPAGDQFFIACENGEILSLPSCTQCNKSAKVSDNDLYAIICSDDLLITVGNKFSVNVLTIR
jgi:photosystem II stability/assembly factor-like uncharacterized protein